MELTCETKITLKELNELINFVDLRKVFNHVQDKHGVPAKDGEVRRWQDGKLHIKTSAGWKLLENTSGYDDKVDNQKKHNKGVDIPITSPEEYKKFVDCLFIQDDKLRQEKYKTLPNVIRFPDLLKTLAYQLGTKPTAMYIFKNQYQHVNQKRKQAHNNQDLTKTEFYEIPNVIKSSKEAVIDLENKNFFITFPDKNNSTKVNKIIFNKSVSGNYLITVGKINKKQLIKQGVMFEIKC